MIFCTTEYTELHRVLFILIVVILHFVIPSVLSSRTERSVVKDLVYIHMCIPLLYASEILRYALDDIKLCVTLW